VLCPAETVNDTAEALHQLVAVARANGSDAMIKYHPQQDDLTAEYAHYDVPVAGAITDQPGLLVVVPEHGVQMVPLETTFSTWAIWWFSPDEYFQTIGGFVGAPPRDTDFTRRLLSPELGILHLAQNRRSRAFLFTRGVRSLTLTDFLGSDWIDSVTRYRHDAKKDVVLYRNDRGTLFNQRLIASAGEHAPGLEFVPVDSAVEDDALARLLGEAKVFIDFGDQGHLDRLSRAAVLAGCVLIVGRRGVAINGEDVPLPQRFIIDTDRINSVAETLSLAARAATDHDEIAPEFDPYRELVLAQQQAFPAQLAAVLAETARPRFGGFKPGVGKNGKSSANKKKSKPLTAARASRGDTAVNVVSHLPPEAPHSGVKALFVLASMLRDRGIDAEVNSPEPDRLQIIPEGFPAEPGAVRWMLFWGSSYPGEHVITWEHRFAEGAPRIQVPITFLDLFRPAPGVERRNAAVWVGKGSYNPALVPEGAVLIPQHTPRGRVDVAEILQRAEYLISFDAATALTMEATLCGTPVVIPAPRPEGADEWLYKDFGHGWEMDLELAKSTVHLAREHYTDVVVPTCERYVDDFAEWLRTL
jgi:hypothetical protein